MAKTPNIRFKGFSEEWQEKPLAAVSDKVTEKNLNRAFTETFTNSAEFGIMSQRDFFDHDISNADNISGYYVVKDNDFVYNPRISKLAPVGPINRNKLGRIGIVSPLYTVFRIKNINIEYLEIFFRQNSWNKYMTFHGNTGARLDRFSINDEVFWQMPILYPHKIEQQKISTLFSNVSIIISQRESELEKLKNIKRALLEKLFPQNGQTVPAIRFKGFTGEWGGKIMGDVFTSFEERNHPELPVLAATQDRGMVIREDIGYSIAHNRSNEVTYKRVLPGQFVIHLRSFQGGFAHSNVEGITSPAYDIFGFKEPQAHNDYYWKYLFSSAWFIKCLGKVTYGIRDGRNISYDEFLELTFRVPLKTEQTKIAKLLKTLSNLLSLRERQLTLLKHTKQALLEQMFVNE